MHCHTCEQVFGKRGSVRAPRMLACGHRVCVSTASNTASSCRLCAAAKLVSSLSQLIETYADLNADIKPGAASAVADVSQSACADCVTTGFIPSPFVSVCEGCNGAHRPLCDDHAYAHRKHACMKRRRLADTDAGLTLDSTTPFLPLFCSAHPDTRITRICSTCNVAVCSECIVMTGAHPEASHAVQLLQAQAATLHHTTQLQAAMDTLPSRRRCWPAC